MQSSAPSRRSASDLESNWFSLRRAPCDPLHHRDVLKEPTTDLHQHRAVYRTAVFLFGHVGTSSSAGSRTPRGGFETACLPASTAMVPGRADGAGVTTTCNSTFRMGADAERSGPEVLEPSSAAFLRHTISATSPTKPGVTGIRHRSLKRSDAVASQLQRMTRRSLIDRREPCASWFACYT